MSDSEAFIGSCKTQIGFEPTIDRVLEPASETSTRSGGTPLHRIVLGSHDGKKIVPRWDIVTHSDRKLLYFIHERTFPDTATLHRAESAFHAAAAAWNDVDFGLVFEEVREASAAHFHLLYKEMGKDARHLATGFFPNEPSDLTIYKAGLSTSRSDGAIKKTFMHELGHIIGLRHEHAVARGESESVRFLGTNEFSIMSYRDERDLQKSDKEEVKAFYKMQNGALIGGIPIQDYPLVLRGSKSQKADA
ncbi:hypothetical protein QBC47DRAFT_401258 [Echria macrotheca]|uniref:Peptidase metallopeptidase domain-containing protein n=1 Tax=Echria macrotheca TaxID=438768 RepID=A0AAJ0BDM1_9PEZI|nr:hypothetical protein QBC47DRAFT_401258 [Echria macrotheca]